MQDDTSTIVRKAEKPAFKRAKIVKFETSMAAGSILSFPTTKTRSLKPKR